MPNNEDKNYKDQAFLPQDIYFDYSLMESMSVDKRLCAKKFDDFKYLLGNTCEITNNVLAIPIKSRESQGVAEGIDSQSQMHFMSTKSPDCKQRFSIYRRSHSLQSDSYQFLFNNNKHNQLLQLKKKDRYTPWER